jgi:hypothetical protein
VFRSAAARRWVYGSPYQVKPSDTVRYRTNNFLAKDYSFSLLVSDAKEAEATALALCSRRQYRSESENDINRQQERDHHRRSSSCSWNAMRSPRRRGRKMTAKHVFYSACVFLKTLVFPKYAPRMFCQEQQIPRGHSHDQKDGNLQFYPYIQYDIIRLRGDCGRSV